MRKVLTIVGARPQFVKCAMMRKVFDEDESFHEVLVHTGQHFDFSMSEVFFQELGIRKPEYFLDINGKNHGAMTGQMMIAIEEVVEKERPEAILVYGDTNSTLAGALVGAKLHIPVIHIEAGLRSFNKKMPEEINRILTDHVSDLLFCPTPVSVENLTNEGIVEGVHWVGDIMYDATKSVIELINPDAITDKFPSSKSKKRALATLHRAENFAQRERAEQIVDYVESFTGEYDVFLPLHPGTRKKLDSMSLNFRNVHIIDPVPYMEMQGLLKTSDLVLTDSGGLQKEAYFHGVRCVTLRDQTEWVETIDNGWNRLWTNENYNNEPREIEIYGSGNSAQKMFQIIKENL